MVIVFRVENKYGEGMYTGRDLHLNHCPEYQPFRFPDEKTFNKKAHPMPSNKLLSKAKEDGLSFGFESIESLNKWLFMREFKLFLHEAGYEVCQYATPEISKDDSRQCVFSVENSEIVEILSLLDV